MEKGGGKSLFIVQHSNTKGIICENVFKTENAMKNRENIFQALAKITAEVEGSLWLFSPSVSNF
jgi:hypothetical protein